MDEYIRRGAAIEETCSDCTERNICGGSCSDTDRLRAIPAADVVEVRQGRWISKNSDGSWRVDACSVCGKDTHYVRYAPAYDYCPNCGAQMDGGRKE